MTRGVAAAVVVVAVDDEVKEACTTIPAALLAAERRANAMAAGTGVLEAETVAGAAAAAAPTRCCCCGEGVEVLRIRRRGERNFERRPEASEREASSPAFFFLSLSLGVPLSPGKKGNTQSRTSTALALSLSVLSCAPSFAKTHRRSCTTLPSALSASQSTGAAPLPTSMRRSTPMMMPSPPTDLLDLLAVLLERSSSNSFPKTRPTTPTPRGKGSAASSRARRASRTLGTGPWTRAGSRR